MRRAPYALFLALTALGLGPSLPVRAQAPVPAGVDLAGAVAVSPVAVDAPTAPVYSAPPVAVEDPPVQRAVKSIGAWVQANPGWTAFIFIALATMIANSLGKYPKAAGAIALLRKAIDLAAPFTHTESPGTWKPPFVTLRDGKLALSLSRPPATDLQPLAAVPPEPPRAA